MNTQPQSEGGHPGVQPGAPRLAAPRPFHHEGGLNILVIEGTRAGFDAIVQVLRPQLPTVDCRWVATRADLMAALGQGGWSAILSNYEVPGFCFEDNLDLIRSRLPEVPVLLVCAPLGEDRALDLLRRGVTDVVHQGRLYRLPALVAQQVEEVASRAARRAAEQELMEEALRRRLLFHQSRDGIVVIDAAARVIEANPRFAEMLGYTVEEVARMQAPDWDPRHDPEWLRALLRHPTGSCGVLETRHRRKDGSCYDAELVCTVAVMHDRALVLCACRDITDRKRVEADLRDRLLLRAQLSAVAENVPGAIISFRVGADGSYGFLYASPSTEELVGVTPAALQADPDLAFRILHPDDRVRLLAQLRERPAVLQPWQDEFRVQHPTRGERWLEGRSTPLRERDGDVIWHGFVADITDRRRADQALRQNELRLRTLFAGVSRLAVQGYAPDGTVRFWNRASEELYGYTAEEAIGRNLVDLIIPPEMRNGVRTAIREMQETGRVIPAAELLLMRKDGSRVPVYSNHVLIEINGAGRELYCIDIDLTDRHTAEEALRLTGAALQAAANAIVITDRAGVIQWVNPAFCAATGYGAADAIGRMPRDLIRSGQQDEGFYHQLWQTILAGAVWQGEIVNRRRNGELYTEDMTITPLRNADNQITHFIAIKQDITERKALEAHVLRNQRLESVGRLASGVAHDLNNILSPMLLAPDLLREYVQDPSARALLDAVESNARRGAEVVRQLLVFGRGLPGERGPVQLQALIQEMAGTIRETFPRNISVEVTAPAGIPAVHGLPTPLHQVLMNLCVNARDAMPDGGRLTLALALVEVDELVASAHAGVRPGPHVRLTVADTGVGIAPDTLEKIFDPFFTTKPVGEGTGLGLSTALGIVRSHHGFVDVETQPGQGSRFHVHLPAHPAGVPPPATASPAATLPVARGQGVLLVDDEPGLRQVLRAVLERGGYQVLEARHGAEALEIYAAQSDRLHLVLTDVMMPTMDGAALVRELRERGAQIPIVVMTGQPTLPASLQSSAAGLRAVLHKPIPSDALLQALRDALPA